MNFKKIILEQLLLEAKIAQISANITLSLDVYETSHSKTRRFRGKDSGVIITNSDIRDLIERAKDTISFHIIQNDIVSGKDFVVSDENGKKISLAIIPEEKTPYHWNLVLKTVFSELIDGESFRVGRDQLHIKI
jgi:hypothetical protein